MTLRYDARSVFVRANAAQSKTFPDTIEFRWCTKIVVGWRQISYGDILGRSTIINLTNTSPIFRNSQGSELILKPSHVKYDGPPSMTWNLKALATSQLPLCEIFNQFWFPFLKYTYTIMLNTEEARIMRHSVNRGEYWNHGGTLKRYI